MNKIFFKFVNQPKLAMRKVSKPFQVLSPINRGLVHQQDMKKEETCIVDILYSINYTYICKLVTCLFIRGMKSLLMIFAVLVILPRCTSDKIDRPSFKLVEFRSGFTYNANEYLSYAMPFGVPSYCCEILYNNGRVSRVIYKNSVSQPFNYDGTLPNPLDSYYEFVYNGDKVTLTKKIDNYDIPYSSQQRDLFLDQNGRIICRIVGKDTINFFYSQNGLLSKSVSRNGGFSVVERNFFFDSNNNLVRIKGFIDNAVGRDIKIFEYFEEYDDAVNRIKNLGIIEGAFIRSLSHNNFNTYSYSTYDQNNTLLDSMRFHLPVTHGANGDPVYGICPGNN